MIILGIDPGLASCGFGVVEKNGQNLRCIDFGVIRTLPNCSLYSRLKEISDAIDELIFKYRPDSVATEEVFFFKNQKTIVSVSQVQGVIFLRAYEDRVPIFKYAPLEIKQTLTGYGRASKSDVQKTVKKILRMRQLPRPDDAADGLAVALFHALKIK